jgi:hypothetical protein
MKASSTTRTPGRKDLLRDEASFGTGRIAHERDLQRAAPRASIGVAGVLVFSERRGDHVAVPSSKQGGY